MRNFALLNDRRLLRKQYAWPTHDSLDNVKNLCSNLTAIETSSVNKVLLQTLNEQITTASVTFNTFPSGAFHPPALFPPVRAKASQFSSRTSTA